MTAETFECAAPESAGQGAGPVLLLRDWFSPPDDTVEQTVASGVDPQTLAVWTNAMSFRAEVTVVAFFNAELRNVRRRWPDLTLADAAWWVIAPLWLRSADDVWGERGFLHRFMQPWADAGMLGDGWRYAIAGLAPAEVTAGLASGTLTAESVATLVALRGLPVAT